MDWLSGYHIRAHSSYWMYLQYLISLSNHKLIINHMPIMPLSTRFIAKCGCLCCNVWLSDGTDFIWWPLQCYWFWSLLTLIYPIAQGHTNCTVAQFASSYCLELSQYTQSSPSQYSSSGHSGSSGSGGEGGRGGWGGGDGGWGLCSGGWGRNILLISSMGSFNNWPGICSNWPGIFNNGTRRLRSLLPFLTRGSSICTFLLS